MAGLTLGIGLRKQGISVVIWEAGSYPRHRVCGEFISGRGQETLARFKLLDLLREEGALPAKTAMFSSGTFSTPVKPLPTPALCLSRSLLDHALAKEFQRLGGDLRVGSRWRGDFREGRVSAVGRHTARTHGSRCFVGLKVHSAGVKLEADLEMHFVPNGYVGLCRLSEGIVNICGLFRIEGKAPQLASEWRKWLSGPGDSILKKRLRSAEFDEETFCTTSGFSLEPRRAINSSEIRIGDSLTMIPPLTGNGMSMAFESAELAIDPIASWSRGEIGWTQVREEIAQTLDARFASRLKWARRLHPRLYQSISRSMLMLAASRSDWFWCRLHSATR